MRYFPLLQLDLMSLFFTFADQSSDPCSPNKAPENALEAAVKARKNDKEEDKQGKCFLFCFVTERSLIECENLICAMIGLALNWELSLFFSAQILRCRCTYSANNTL